MEELAEAGRLDDEVNKANSEAKKGLKKAEELLGRGWAEKCVWLETNECILLVPSASSDRMYKVDLIRAICECPATSQKGRNVCHYRYQNKPVSLTLKQRDMLDNSEYF